METLTIDEAVARKVLYTIDAGLVAGIGDPEPGKMCVEAAVCYALGLPHGDAPSCVSSALRKLKIALNDCAWSSDTARAAGLRRLGLIQLGSAGVLDDAEFINRVVVMTVNTSVADSMELAASLQSEARRVAMIACAKVCREAADVSAAWRAAESAAESAASAAWRAAESAAESAAEIAAESAARSAAESAASAAWRAAESAAWRAAESAAESAASAARAAESVAYSAYSAASAASADSAAYSAAYSAYSAWSAAESATESAARAAESGLMGRTYDTLLSEYAERVVQILIEMKVPGVRWLHLTENEKEAS